MPKKPTEEELQHKELADRKAVKDFKVAEARNAYPKVKKSWDYGRLSKEPLSDERKRYLDGRFGGGKEVVKNASKKRAAKKSGSHSKT